jgi:predicted ATPase
VAVSASLLLPESAPIPRTRLIGRESERATARSLLLADASPLLTLVGPGGVGKTRLALAIASDVATRFAEDVAWVDFSSVHDPALVPGTIANALALSVAPNRSVAEELVRCLRPRQTLLLLDNCEHVLPGIADLVARLLAACPALQVLATSRAPLHLRGEQVLTVAPLSLPAAIDRSLSLLQHNEAVRLFVERARGVRPAFALSETNAATVGAICRALDGLPLAIELAAARMALLSPEALLAQVTDRLSLLSDGRRDAPSRQRTMEAAIAWSYDLLAAEEQAFFRCLAVFSGGFSLEGAEWVSGIGDRGSEESRQSGEAARRQADVVLLPITPGTLRGLTRLVDQSLVHRIERDGEPRFAMLETIRAFALERLEASE